MKEIFVIGAGRSASSLIDYLLKQSVENDWRIVVGDRDIALAKDRIGDHAHGQALVFDLFDPAPKEAQIAKSDLVISMLPASLHLEVAKSCLELGKHLLTASYISPEMKALSPAVKEKDLVFLNECGLDPGIDHMTAKQAIDRIKSAGGVLQSFKSFTGGLVAPESDDNPWHYKFTWNPRNVVLAGQGTAKLIRQGRYKYIPYSRLFTRTEPVFIEGLGDFEGYPNRDSLKYRAQYDLENIPTMIRGTLRRPGFCEAWNVFVQLGLTDDSYTLENSENMTYRDYVNTFLYYHPSKSAEEKLCDYLSIDPGGSVFRKIAWSGLFKQEMIGLANATPAQILQHLLEDKWQLNPDDKDMIVMQHQFEFDLDHQRHRLTSSLVTFGSEQPHTAMSKTVGWPLGIAAKLVLTDLIKSKGVITPMLQEVYEPILAELRELGVEMQEAQTSI